MKNIQIKDKKRAFNKSIILFFFCQKTVILQKKAKKTDENL